jgi:hypothetical protein
MRIVDGIQICIRKRMHICQRKRKRLIVSDPLVAQSSEGGGSSKEVLLVYDLDLFIEDVAGDPVDRHACLAEVRRLPDEGGCTQ